jgi:OOP family OmpA-OmpF porin
MKLKFLAGAALAATFAASGAYAQDAGWYGAVDVGAHQPEHFSIHTASFPSQQVNLHQDGDWVGFARVGYRFDPHWRLELEGGYRPGKWGSLSAAKFSGHADDGSVMLNLLYDIAPEWSLHPFVGLGAGVDHEFVKETASFTTPPPGSTRFESTGENAFA